MDTAELMDLTRHCSGTVGPEIETWLQKFPPETPLKAIYRAIPCGYWAAAVVGECLGITIPETVVWPSLLRVCQVHAVRACEEAGLVDLAERLRSLDGVTALKAAAPRIKSEMWDIIASGAPVMPQKRAAAYVVGGAVEAVFDRDPVNLLIRTGLVAWSTARVVDMTGVEALPDDAVGLFHPHEQQPGALKWAESCQVEEHRRAADEVRRVLPWRVVGPAVAQREVRARLLASVQARVRARSRAALEGWDDDPFAGGR